ncbi:uncharacterized protein [Parasteatoda tepidariorum]|uniref:uncharacterized protein n=1 Tax=Parasteatoda tepidariorum TaxID=114398 RepID=UPI00077F8AC9|nr:uncharacterized protein LOC107443644 [Parasteatoda tepidariorum]XP_015913072.1 uncharacterized protein LOC107443644 [Parasteatoda tepidariorum]
MARDSGKIIGFSFNWRIEDFTLCLHNKYVSIDSPVFRIKQFQNSAWRLELDLRGAAEENINLNLFRCIDDLNDSSKVATDVRLFIEKTDGSCVFTDRVNIFFSPSSRYIEPLTLSKKTVLDTYLNKDILTVGLHFFISSEPFLLENVPVECNARSKLIKTEYSILLPLKVSEMYNNSEYSVTSPFASTSTEHPEFQIELHCYVCNDNKNPVTITIHMAKSDFKGFLQCKLSFLNKEVVKYMCKNNYTFVPGMDDPAWRIDISKETYSKYSISDSLCLKCELLASTGKFTSILEKTVYKQEISDDSNSNSFNMSYLQSNLLEMYENKILCDFKVLVSGKEFSVHKTILSAMSPVFQAMFESGMTETAKSQVTIEEYSVDAVEKMLNFSYSNRVTGLEWNASLELYSIADKYQIQKLKTICSSFLESTLSAERVPDLLALANLHEDAHLSKIADNFICGNSKAVFQSTVWENFMKVNAQVASETMYRICKLFSEININPLD